MGKPHMTATSQKFSEPTSPSRACLALCLRHSVQIQLYGWISDTLGTLGETAEVINYEHL